MLDGDCPPARDLEQVLAVELIAQWLGRQFPQQRMLRRILFRPMQTAETPRVVKSQDPAAVQNQIPVIMLFRRRVAADQAQAAGHPEMQDHGAGLQTDEQVLRAPIDAADDLIAHRRFEFCGNRPAQAPVAHDHVDDAMAYQSGRNAASRGLYFRKLGQGRGALSRLLDLRFFVSDVLADHGIEFLRLQLVRMQTLVLGGRVVVTGAGR